MNRKYALVLTLFVIVSLTLAGCFVEFDPTAVGVVADPYDDDSGNLVSKKVEDSATDTMGKLTITLHLTDGKITKVEFKSAGATINNELETSSCQFQQMGLKDSWTWIPRNNSVEMPDVTTGATTRRAIREAGRKALASLGGSYTPPATNP